MKKKRLLRKMAGSAVIAALAVSGAAMPLPQQVQAAEDYHENNWREEGFVSVHDPSIVVGYEKDGKVSGKEQEGSKKVYYIFGSHLAWAYSYDLVDWTAFRNNLSDYNECNKQFKVGADWAKIGDSNYVLANAWGTNVWAPDVIWNEAMGKWCMYMSINGSSWNSTIALLTSDSLNGDWTYVDTIIYSGFTKSEYKHDYTLTDYQKVTGDTDLPDRYITNPYSPAAGKEQTTWDINYGAHAIDPCVLYDDEGNLWMTYGSWSGGIYMIGLDESTGLRDYNQKYDLVENESDPYMGIRLGGGWHASGEASYIQKIGDYYYLFITYGVLEANGGYNVRCFRSDKITGPYVDDQGNSAIYTKWANNINGSIGERLMSYYKWSWHTYGEAAQGHNSAFVDTDGRAYIIYHTRTDTYGIEHHVRVHELYQNENGWLVEAPFAYKGETKKEGGYSAGEAAGSYEVILQGPTVYSQLETNKGVDITLNADGTVTCATDKSYNGTWAVKDGYMSITLGDTVFNGVFVTGTIEGTNDQTVCFTALADQPSGENAGRCLWGAKLTDSLSSYIEGRLELNKAKVSIVKGKTSKLKVMDNEWNEVFSKKAVWKSSNSKIAKVNSNGKVTAKKVGKATIKATIGGKTMTCKVTVKKKTVKKK